MPAKDPRSIELLLEVGRLLSSKLDLPELLRTVLELSSRVVNAETASLLLLDPQSQELYFDVALGLDPDLARVRLKLGQGIAGTVAQDGRPLIINDVQKDPRWSSVLDKSSGFVTRSILAAPMTLKGRRLGVVEALNHMGEGFSEEDLRVFEAFASQAAVAIENARLFAGLSAERAKLRAVLNEMADAAVLVDASGRLLFANAAARKFFTVGDAPTPQTLLEAARGMTLAPPLDSLLSSGEGVLRFEAVREEPKRLVLEGTVSRIQESFEGESSRNSRVIVFRDVTEERHEEALKRGFLSLISHKLKTPLASITGYGQLLLEEALGKGSPEMQVKALRTICGQGQKLANLVEKLLNYTVMEALDSTPLKGESLSVDALLLEATRSLDGWLKENNAQVLVEAGSGLKVWGDGDLLKEVVKNLLENGVKFDPRPKRKVALWATPGEDGIEVHVRDNGPGIPPEEQDKIFQKFYQVESSFTGQVEGWGLGLPFVRKVAQKHGGGVRVHSQAGVGSTFTVRLPRADAAR